MSTSPNRGSAKSGGGASLLCAPRELRALPKRRVGQRHTRVAFDYRLALACGTYSSDSATNDQKVRRARGWDHYPVCSGVVLLPACTSPWGIRRGGIAISGRSTGRPRARTPEPGPSTPIRIVFCQARLGWLCAARCRSAGRRKRWSAGDEHNLSRLSDTCPVSRDRPPDPPPTPVKSACADVC
jgi:hypothetical protein